MGPSESGTRWPYPTSILPCARLPFSSTACRSSEPVLSQKSAVLMRTAAVRTQQCRQQSLSQHRVIHPTMGVLLHALIMIGISWHHYLLLLSVTFLQGKKKFPILYSKGSNLHVWSLSVPTQVKRCMGFSTVLEGILQCSKTPIFPSFLCTG